MAKNQKKSKANLSSSIDLHGDDFAFGATSMTPAAIIHSLRITGDYHRDAVLLCKELLQYYIGPTSEKIKLCIRFLDSQVLIFSTQKTDLFDPVPSQMYEICRIARYELLPDLIEGIEFNNSFDGYTEQHYN